MSTNRYKQAQRVTIIGAFINTLLGIIKVWGGLIFNSHGLVADGIHSFSDLLIDGMVLVASKLGSQDADASHPYGHQRIETAGTLFLSVILISAGASIAWDAFLALFQDNGLPHRLALGLALVSILLNECLYHYTFYVGKKIASSLIIANAWHHRSDAASSLAVAVGLIASLMGYGIFDAVAAVIVGFLIIKMGVDYGWNSVKELIDTAVDKKTYQRIHDFIASIEGVEKVHELRTRLMAGEILVDVHILVSPKISVSEGHYIAQQVHYRLMKHLPVRDAVVHVDPEDDEDRCPSLSLPSRDSLEKQFLLGWQREFPQIKNWVLHYLNGTIHIDLEWDGDRKNNATLVEKIEKLNP